MGWLWHADVLIMRQRYLSAILAQASRAQADLVYKNSQGISDLLLALQSPGLLPAPAPASSQPPVSETDAGDFFWTHCFSGCIMVT